MALVRLVVFGFILLTIIYFSVSIYSRSVRREKLEKAFDADAPAGADAAARDAYVEKGMAEYNNSIRPRLIGLVYVIPIMAVSAIVYLTNAN